MKHIDRNRVAMPAVLAERGSKAANERKKVKAHYSDPDCATYDFSVYKDREVLAALNKLFNDKCAYCEGSYRATSPTDIEHFRPKGRVSNATGHKGYWWLASTWSNLLASCILCNREQYNDLFDITATGLNPRLTKSGKVDHFPLAGPYRAFAETDDLTREDPLLIDPSQRDPAEYLIWKKMQGLQVIVPRDEAAATTPYARTSIQTYGLNRRPLVEERTRIAQAIEADAKVLASHLSFASELEPVTLAGFMPILESTVSAFVGKKENHPQYVGMIEYLVDRELEKMLDQLQALRDRCNALR
ncbi:hypothetical protein VDF13_14865 [Xanthomonas campestris pv. raphani]|uniref:hypothetical protein n=1 Tax=Xanthomonas campestris TaxID=339 RepID=UPI001E3F76D4|nr:hypothetical protein [Xanthomonas campestris]MCC8484984.1 hypothetical protein [Xanthomonas campestris]MEA9651411.1 hypothetical protein [Xanthomonas campestris pv. raphani]MEA9657963.1 hypothetical protein [Xanthomonas campestris pv. raphani]MEA9740993.1 hypothetical protein [Xanthomonas campestris pv. raphani]MEA9744624.1 hypothetical protein [Xanthomonas campestris pv. raphani]